MNDIATWAEAHPALLTAIVWPALTALCTALFKPRTPEQYAALPPRLAAFLQLVGALGLDPVKAVDATKKLVTGKAAES